MWCFYLGPNHSVKNFTHTHTRILARWTVNFPLLCMSFLPPPLLGDNDNTYLPLKANKCAHRPEMVGKPKALSSIYRLNLGMNSIFHRQKVCACLHNTRDWEAKIQISLIKGGERKNKRKSIIQSWGLTTG